jgi:hypothetical protein
MALRLLAPMAAVLLSVSAPKLAAQEAPAEWLARMSLPRWVDSVIGPLLLKGRYALGLRLNPFFQVGDFDKDGRTDAAVFAREGTSGKEGILLLRRVHPSPTVIGMGHPFGNGGDNFTWLDIWRVEPAAGGDRLVVEKRESASGAISWDGKGYRWTQLSD